MAYLHTPCGEHKSKAASWGSLIAVEEAHSGARDEALVDEYTALVAVRKLARPIVMVLFHE